MSSRRALALLLTVGIAGGSAALAGGAAHAAPASTTKVVIGVDGFEGTAGKTAVGGTFFDLTDSKPAAGLKFTGATLNFGDKTKVKTFAKGKVANWTANHPYTKPGTYTVVVTAKLSNHTSVVRKEKVSVFTPPTVTITGPKYVKVGQTGTFAVAAAKPAGTAWLPTSYTFGDTNGQSIAKGTPPAVLTHVFTKASAGAPGGFFTVGIAVQDNANGTASASFPIVVLP